MTTANGIDSLLVIAKQPAEGTKALTAAGRLYPRVTATFDTDADKYSSNEIDPSQQQGDTDEGADQLVHVIDDNQKRLALAVAVDWYGFTSNGAVVPFDKGLIATAFDKYPTWQERVTAALENDANFLKV